MHHAVDSLIDLRPSTDLFTVFMVHAVMQLQNSDGITDMLLDVNYIHTHKHVCRTTLSALACKAYS